MPSISFNTPPPVTKPSEPQAAEPVVDAVVEEKESPAAIVPAAVPVQTMTIASPTFSPAVADGVVGEVTSSDITLPRINLVQKVGNLADAFAPGSILFEKTVILADTKSAVDLTPLRIRKQYQRKVEWGQGQGEQPEVYDTAAQVREAGGSLQYGDENYFQDVAHIEFGIKLPKSVGEGASDVLDLFPFQFAGDQYAVAIWTVASSSYTALAKPLFTAAASLLRNGLFNGHYSVSTEIRKNANNSWYVPKATFMGKHTPEAAEFFKSIAGL